MSQKAHVILMHLSVHMKQEKLKVLRMSHNCDISSYILSCFMHEMLKLKAII